VAVGDSLTEANFTITITITITTGPRRTTPHGSLMAIWRGQFEQQERILGVGARPGWSGELKPCLFNSSRLELRRKRRSMLAPRGQASPFSASKSSRFWPAGASPDLTFCLAKAWRKLGMGHGPHGRSRRSLLSLLEVRGP
jgi:hypothetical protein